MAAKIEYDGLGDVLDGEYDDVSELQADIDGELDQLMSDFSDSGMDALSVRVYRPLSAKGKFSYLFTCLITDLPILDRLRNEEGGGDFHIRVLKDKKIFRKFEVSVEKPTNKPEESLEKREAGLSEVMAKGFMHLGELISKSNQTQQLQNTPSVMEMQAGLMQQMIAMKEFVGESKQVSPVKQLTEMMQLKELLNSSDTKSEEKEANTNDVLVALIENVMPSLVTTASEHKLTTRESAKTIQKAEGNTEKMNIKYKMQLIFLCNMAKKNSSVETYANMIIDNVEEKHWGSLLEQSKNEEKSFNEMCKIHPGVKEYKEWFSELGKEIVRMLGDDLSEDEIPTTITGEPLDSQPGVVIVPENIKKTPESYERKDVDDPERESGNVIDSETNERVS